MKPALQLWSLRGAQARTLLEAPHSDRQTAQGLSLSPSHSLARGTARSALLGRLGHLPSRSPCVSACFCRARARARPPPPPPFPCLFSGRRRRAPGSPRRAPTNRDTAVSASPLRRGPGPGPDEGALIELRLFSPSELSAERRRVCGAPLWAELPLLPLCRCPKEYVQTKAYIEKEGVLVLCFFVPIFFFLTDKICASQGSSSLAPGHQ